MHHIQYQMAMFVWFLLLELYYYDCLDQYSLLYNSYTAEKSRLDMFYYLLQNLLQNN